MIERATGQVVQEKIYGAFFIHLLYSNPYFASLRYALARFPFFSKVYGLFQKAPWSRFKIPKFIKRFGIDPSEFDTTHFTSFNDFFTRKLKPNARPISNHDLILPADGRYRAFKRIHDFEVKGKCFNLKKLLLTDYEPYLDGSMLIARLCPTDYHRFHFPCDCIPEAPRTINGPLYSVNPLAIKRNLKFLTQNKRVVTPLHTEKYGTIQYIEIGATHIGSIRQTFTPGQPVHKGQEKGYFEFGGSCIVLLFENALSFDPAFLKEFELQALVGQPFTGG